MENKPLTDEEHKALAGMSLRINREGNGLTAIAIPKGEPLPEEKMNATQRSAFRKISAASFPPKDVDPGPTAKRDEPVVKTAQPPTAPEPEPVAAPEVKK
jgi:hypothetical protein